MNWKPRASAAGTALTFVAAPDFESGVVWNDPDLKISWPIDQPVLSPKDAALPQLKNAKL